MCVRVCVRVRVCVCACVRVCGGGGGGGGGGLGMGYWDVRVGFGVGGCKMVRCLALRSAVGGHGAWGIVEGGGAWCLGDCGRCS